MYFDNNVRSGRMRNFTQRTSLRGSCQQRRVILGRVDVQGDERIADRHVLNVLLIAMFDIARVGGCRCLQKYSINSRPRR